jgi:hypothetical protein
MEYSSAMGRFMSLDWAAQGEQVPCANLADPQNIDLCARSQSPKLSQPRLPAKDP